MSPPLPRDLEAFGWLWKTQRPPRRLRWSALEIAPVVDIVLLLFLFFLVNASFVLQPGITMQLPLSTFESGGSYRDLVVAISADGLLFYNDEHIAIERLSPVFAEGVAKDPSVRLLIEADIRVSHGTLVHLYNMAREAGIGQVTLATQPRSR